MNDQPDTAAMLAETSEERHAKRHRVLLRGQIGFNNNFVTVPCAVRNISETGAMLVLDAPASIPDKFTLYVELSGFKVECCAAWHRGLALGAHFTSEKRPVKTMRSQHLGTSETALSQQTVHAMEMLDRRRTRTDVDGVPAAQQAGKAAAKPAFGKRITD